MCKFSAFRHFFKTNVAQSVAKLVLYSQKHEMWSFSFKFGELSRHAAKIAFLGQCDSITHILCSIQRVLKPPFYSTIEYLENLKNPSGITV